MANFKLQLNPKFGWNIRTLELKTFELQTFQPLDISNCPFQQYVSLFGLQGGARNTKV